MPSSNDKAAALQWCNDNLHDLLGFADGSLAQYLVSVASKPSASPAAIHSVLTDGGITNNAEALERFSEQLYHKVQPGKGTTSNKPRPKKSNADWLKAAAQYTTVDDDDFDETAMRKAKKAAKKERKEKKQHESRSAVSSRSIKRPRASSSSSDDDQEDVEQAVLVVQDQAEARRQQRRQEKKKKPLSPEEQAELERQQDLAERDAFVQRMLERDASKTKQKIKTEQNDTSLAAQAAVEERLARGETVQDEASGQELSLDRLQTQSRRDYLKKRQEREIELLRQKLADEERLFGSNAKLTKAERKQLEIERKILAMADAQKLKEEQGDHIDGTDGYYRLPGEYDESTSKRSQDQALLKTRYLDKHEKTEQELWEESQTQKAAGIHVHNKKGKKDASEKEYSLIMDEQVEFVMQEKRKGYDDRRKGKSELKMEPQDMVPVMTEHEKMLAGRKKLPVFPYREEFLAAVKEHQVLILCGETGSGKTTQLPQYLHEIGYSELGKIGCTQPRRVAAMSVAARVATEMNVRLGHEVGYSIRFENCTSPKTVISYMTDGMLLREILTEPDLASYSCMVIDEAHERTIHTDVLMTLIKDIVRFRPDLRLIISSATLDANKFSKYFDDAAIFMIPGRMYPVDIYYTKAPEADYVDAAIVTCLQIHVSQPLDGDILIFLTGQDEIETAAEILIQRARNLGSRIAELIICPIYANLPSDQQAKIFDKTPKGARKVVIGTNIAETSLTIDGICYVIDSGFQKQKSYNARSGMESLVVVPVSQAAANQRAGRAGRTQPGKAFRLYTAWSFQHELEPNTVPEILRTNMANVVLMLKSLGINDLVHFDFLDKPPSDALIRALEQLYALGALNDRGELTKLGRRMAEFPLDPMLSKSVIASEKYKCTSQVLSAVAMLSLGASVFYRPKEKKMHADTARLNFARGGGGDHMALMRCYEDWAAADYSPVWCHENYCQVKSMKKARDIRDQLENLCERVEIDHSVSNADDMDGILKSITSGFFYNVAKLSRSGEYQTVKTHKTVYIHPSSVLAKKDSDELPPAWVTYLELAFTSKEYMRQVAPIQPSWLIEIAPHYYQENDVQDAKARKMPKTKQR